MTTLYPYTLNKYVFPIIILLLSITTHTLSQENKELQKAVFLVDKGFDLYSSEDYDVGIQFYDQALKISKELKNDSLVSIIHTLKGHIHLRNGKNKDALQEYTKGLQFAKFTEHKELEVKANAGLIVILRRMNRSEKALNIALRSLEIIPKTNMYRKDAHVSILVLSSEVYLAREEYDSTLFYVEKALEISKQLSYKEAILDLYIKKGMVYYHKKQYNASLDYLLKAKNILDTQEISNKAFPIINTTYYTGSCYYEQGLYDKAIPILEDGINNFEETDFFKPPAIRAHLLLANCYNEKKDYEKGSFWQKKYMELNDAYQKDKDQTIDIIHEKETNQLQQKITDLENNQQQAKTKLFIFLFVISLAMVILSYNYIKKQKSNKVVFQNLMQEINQLESVNKQTEIQEQSKKEISIDDQKVQEIIKGIEKLETQEYFLKSDCNLRTMAKKLKTNATYLSQTINQHKEKSFTEYINDLRITYVLKRLQEDSKFRSYAIQSIASEIGYKSSYSLVKHFKAKTGINPSYYIKSLNKQETTSEIKV
ncbi:helix-turn-helix domain-containing protein [uncultured Aquimarina sp.]|uniref:helix-turn-helix domain-containing protein n=1 Tax=uncultured Aquimarina sp. TaxID=575652 RepID=UPI002635108F|nr:helix-turn-helix domain-containing protein [uncultured Aquimarina sp.]